MKKIYSIAAALALIFSVQNAFSQSANSPYTVLGQGNYLGLGSMRNNAMGGVGVSMGSYQFSNLLNPALLTHNKFTVFEAAFYMEQRNLEESGFPSQSDIGGGISYFNFAFPVSRNWTMGLGLRPMTTVNYEVNNQVELLNDQGAIVNYYEKKETGDGGLNQVYFSHGVNIWKGLVLGVELGYVFGNLDREFSSTLLDGQSNFIVTKLERINHRQFTFKPGLLYTQPIGDKDKAKKLNFGATWQPKLDYNFKYDQALIIKNSSDVAINVDTLDSNSDLKEVFPQVVTMGASFEQTGKYSVGVDYENRSISSSDLIKNNNTLPSSGFQLKDSQRLSIGGEYTPDYLSASNYWKRITVRAGFKYEEFNYEKYISSAQSSSTLTDALKLDDYSFSAGFSLPIGRGGASTLTMTGIYGWTEGQNENALREEYFKLQLGLTINDPSWFIKRRVN
ncbi:hypothetical protein V6R21_31105 [Limibacter armeniacum]|uniref:hypothetical protein n=1 Tax=Limibacter armeniacum TaxID=466084 RepID=UPI002FE693D9